jgi:glycosyltransferase involved in cell wall biosynthesis
MSNDVKSGIFDSIMGYFKDYSEDINYVISIKPIQGADIYHYHRPHLESELVSPSVSTVHHDLKDTDSWLDPKRFYDRYHECEKVICLNTSQENTLNKMGICDTVVIPHGYREDIFKPAKKEGLLNRKVRIGLVSKRYGRKVKGEAYLYELMKRISPGSVEWIFVGEGRTEDAFRARELGFDAKVYERLPYNVFGSLYEHIDVLLMCSWHEGGPANIPEAIASATPVIGFNVGMVKDLVIHGVNGLILTSNVKNDTEMLNDIFQNKDKIISLNENIISGNGMTCITWKECISRNIAVYKGCK